MTITLGQLLLYIGALMVLFLTPVPVWFAIIARTVSGGAQSSIALALGVSFGDMLWPIIVFFGLNLLISLYSNILLMVNYFASIILALMGLRILIKSNNRIEENHSLTSSGIIAGFLAVLQQL
jgi:threonine/homoserine/homoserine lactone efflux protein